MTFPVGEYSHNNSGFYKCSITGGYIYRGSQISGMNGVYFFADYCSQEIGMLSYNSSSDSWDMYLDSPNATGAWVTFGEDIDGELYIASMHQVMAMVLITVILDATMFVGCGNKKL